MAWTKRTKIWKRFSYARRVQPRKDELETSMRIQLSLFLLSLSLSVLVRFCSSELFICVCTLKVQMKQAVFVVFVFAVWALRGKVEFDSWHEDDEQLDGIRHNAGINPCVCVEGWQQATVARSPRTHVVSDGGRKTLTTSGNLPADEVWICFRSCWHNLARQSFALIRPNVIHDSTMS